MHELMSQDYIAPEDLAVFKDDSNNLSVRIKGRGEWRKVAVRLAFPYSDPERYIALVHDAEQIGMIRDLSGLAEGSRALLQEVLKKRYHIPEILRVLAVREANNAAVWRVETDRGPRDLLVRDRHNFRKFKDGNLIIVDVDGNRFRISPYRSFDVASQRLMDSHG